MTAKTLSFIMFIILILGSCIIIFVDESSKAIGNEIFVDDNFYKYRDGTAEFPYRTIQDALRAAKDGDTIYVFGGSYNETLNINKRVTLMGSIEEGNSIINYGSDHKYTVQITADYVNFTGFNVTDIDNKIISQINGALIRVTASNVILLKNNITKCSNGWGLYLDSSDGHLIKDNHIDNSINGIYSYYSDTNDIVGNRILNCTSAAIKIQSSHHNTLYENILGNNNYGVYALNCENINITNNTVEGNNLRGIGVYGGTGQHVINNNNFNDNVNEGLYLNSPYGSVTNNIFENNQIGTTVDADNYNINYNYINTSSSVGIKLLSGSSGNVIYLNAFYDNEVSALDYGSNSWFNESLKSGNTWDDYNEVDKDEDGIGDVVYTSGGVYDKYPLGIFLFPPNKPIDPSPEDGEDNIGLKITLSVKVTDQEADLMDVYFYNGTDSFLGVDYNVFSGDRASCSFNLPFDTTFAWYAIVKDSKLENRSDIWFFMTRSRPIINDPPIANAGGPYSGAINDTIVFDASNSYDPDGKIEFYRWNFGDETSEILSVSPAHVYYKPGIFNVTLTIIDDNGTSAMDIVEVTIGSSATWTQDPVADHGGPYHGKVGDVIYFDGSGSHDPDLGDGITAYNWSFDDGYTSTQEKPIHSYSKAGNYTVILTVIDKTGRTDTKITYALIKTKQTGEESPGYEIILAIIAMLFVSIIFRKKKK